MKRRCALIMWTALAAPVLVGPGAAAGQPGPWPQWRGPGRDGQSPGPAWPDGLQGDHLRQLWRVELGPSYSGPVVGPDRVFVTETRDRASEVVRALDRRTGRELWRAEWKGALAVPFFARSNGDWIRSTPAYDGESLYVAGMRDVLVCLDAASGQDRWRVDFLERYRTPLPAFGFVSSPLVDGEGVYVQAGASVVRLDRRTGAARWRALADGGGMWGSAFSSPVIATLQGRRQLLVQTRAKLAGVDLDTGKVLWSRDVPAFRGMNILTPSPHGDSVFTSAYGGRSHLLAIEKEGEGLTVRDGWTSAVEGYMSSPLILGGHLYLHLRNQRFCCIDLETGVTRWTSSERFGKYWSMVARKDRILALDERGILYLIQASPERLQILDERKISDSGTWAHLAVSESEIHVRALDGITAWAWR